jgi:hypothetical protein
MTDRFIPATMARSIGDGVFFRPIRSWHSGTYAGEKLRNIPGSADRSGCLFDEKIRGALDCCSPPHTVTHRLYWHERDATKTLSAFLSYPNGMGCSDQYFWEAYGLSDNDIERYFGDGAEAEMETAIKQYFSVAVEA